MLIEQERIERQEMLVADLHSSTGRFLDNNAPNWLREKIDVQARPTLFFFLFISFFLSNNAPNWLREKIDVQARPAL
jgi:hypothetical protein